MLNSTHLAPIISEPGGGLAVHVLGADLKIKISSRDTNGAFAVFEGHTQPHEGPPLHRHQDHDEYWFIVRGEYRFEVDNRDIYASAGATVFAPRGASHTFQNVGSEPGWTITTVVPGGVDLFFEELAALCPRGTRPDPAKLHSVFQKYNQELLRPQLSPTAVDSRSNSPLAPRLLTRDTDD